MRDIFLCEVIKYKSSGISHAVLFSHRCHRICNSPGISLYFRRIPFLSLDKLIPKYGFEKSNNEL